MHPNQRFSDTIFHIEVEKIVPNPYQPRFEFDENTLKDLSDSIRQYGVLQPLVVSRNEKITEDGGMMVEYELVAGERRLRASKLVGLTHVPAVIRYGDDNLMKLELAIIENIQREDLNSVDRARAFMRFVDEFGYTHEQVAKKVGKSRVYVTNTLRILNLPQDILDALIEGKITEGHTRPLLMLEDRPEEQSTLLKEIIYKKINVREAERISRRVAYDRARIKEYIRDPDLVDLEEKLREKLGTRVKIDKKDFGGQITIDFFSNDDVRNLLDVIERLHLPDKNTGEMLDRYIENGAEIRPLVSPDTVAKEYIDSLNIQEKEEYENGRKQNILEKEEENDDLYSITNFSI